MAKKRLPALDAHQYVGDACAVCKRDRTAPVVCPGYITAADIPGMTWRKDDHADRGRKAKASGRTARRSK